jgi:hypothetical protein
VLPSIGYSSIEEIYKKSTGGWPYKAEIYFVNSEIVNYNVTVCNIHATMKTLQKVALVILKINIMPSVDATGCLNLILRYTAFR